ncbi:hypothetical protein L226DRAFT_576386 [Lentinus tigrinus ALCF2SS1-7]|uniref:Uncharacterized protein n=1 Tax=Lentinus tigrinus ALCF2SS1-6 TaxID=1328759 RepID=A0A5C2RPP9_9APHY|nr:hypothetical protein L227DRAFT_617070 [Lentinus tigrinus ALCF2SS1-6]RPD68506.1 hypothetical protein L226DRAFT_576386 [Lentinus tigrinus ALCF2SS1-7]
MDNDGDHDILPHRFHSLYYSLHKKGQTNWRKGLRDLFLQSVIDHLTVLDRAGAGITVLLHCPATRPPRTRAIPEEVKVEAFLPRALMIERPDVTITLSRITQYYAKYVAVPGMERWDIVNNSASWTVNRVGVFRPSAYRAFNQPIMPDSPSPRYTIYGHRPGELEQLIGQQQATSYPAPPPPQGAAKTQVLSLPDKEHIKLSYSVDDPYMAEELLAFAKAHYESTLGTDMPPPSSRSAGK